MKFFNFFGILEFLIFDLGIFKGCHIILENLYPRKVYPQPPLLDFLWNSPLQFRIGYTFSIVHNTTPFCGFNLPNFSKLLDDLPLKEFDLNDFSFIIRIYVHFNVLYYFTLEKVGCGLQVLRAKSHFITKKLEATKTDKDRTVLS